LGETTVNRRAALITIFVFACVVMSQPAQSLRLNITNAAYATSKYPYYNFGDGIPTLEVATNHSSIEYAESYLEIPTLNGNLLTSDTVGNVTLHLWVSDIDSTNNDINIFESNSFDETTLTWNNAPKTSNLIKTYTPASGAGVWQNIILKDPPQYICLNFTWTSTTQRIGYASDDESNQYLRPYVTTERPCLLTPENGSIINGTFPPMTYPVNFTWMPEETGAYQIQIAKDTAFNLIEEDEHVGTNYTIAYLPSGKHYWRVRSYSQETEEYGNWSYTYNLTLTLQTSTDGTTGIHGVVYADDDNDVEGAYVTIWNDTWTSGMITGSNGYFLFTGLDNESTYSLQAVKDGYEESNVELVTPALGEWTEKNIYLQPCTSALECFYNSHFVRLTYYDSYWTANPVQGLTVKVYEGTSTDVKYQSTTDHTGSVVFLLVKNQEYTITFTGQGVSDSYTITPSEDNYQFYGSGEVGEWDEDEHDIIEDINISVWTSTINATHAKIHVYYNDTLNMTNEVVVYLNQTNTSDYQNQTLLDTYTASSSEFTWTPTVSDYRGQSYHVRLDVNHSGFGEFTREYGVRFKGILVDLGWSESVYLLFAVGLMLFVGAIFTATSVGVGSMVVVMLGWIFYFIGWLNYIPGSKMLIGLIFATVVALAANMAIKTQREGIG